MFHWSSLPLWNYVSRFGAVILGLLSFFASPSGLADGQVYVPYEGIIKGTEGASPVTLSVANETGKPIVCSAALAHWYSKKLGRAEPGASMDVTLWHAPDTGVLNLMNQTNNRMPIEAIWCGTDGNLSATGVRIALPFAAGPAPAVVARICLASDDGRLNCNEVDE